jgi:hypothetical protein
MWTVLRVGKWALAQGAEFGQSGNVLGRAPTYASASGRRHCVGATLPVERVGAVPRRVPVGTCLTDLDAVEVGSGLELATAR